MEGLVDYDDAIARGEALHTTVEAAIRATIAKENKNSSPDFIWFSSAPGSEEEAILGIQNATSETTPVIGGSSADNRIEQLWYQVSSAAPIMTKNGMSYCVCWPSVQTQAAFYSGYGGKVQTQFLITTSIHTYIYTCTNT